MISLGFKWRGGVEPRAGAGRRPLGWLAAAAALLAVAVTAPAGAATRRAIAPADAGVVSVAGGRAMTSPPVVRAAPRAPQVSPASSIPSRAVVHPPLMRGAVEGRAPATAVRRVESPRVLQPLAPLGSGGQTSPAWSVGGVDVRLPAAAPQAAPGNPFRVQLRLPPAPGGSSAVGLSSGAPIPASGLISPRWTVAPAPSPETALSVGDVVSVPASLFGASDADGFLQARIEAVEAVDAVAQAPQRPPARRGADATGAAPERIQVELMVIHATNDKKGFDPRIARFKKQLEFLSYTGFDLMSQEQFTLGMGQTQKTPVSEGKIVETTLVSGTSARVHLRMRLIKPDPEPDVLLDTTVTIPRKGTFFVGGPKYDRGVLILPVTANY